MSKRALLLMNDLPGVAVQAVLSPSPDRLGGSDVTLNVEERRLEAGLGVDNRGTRFLGPTEGLGNVRLNGGLGWGEVTSYGRLARSIGRRGAARAVGGSVGRNPIGLAIPCHRVIAGDGTIGGYGGDWFGSREALLSIKRELLAREGVGLPVRSVRD